MTIPAVPAETGSAKKHPRYWLDFWALDIIGCCDALPFS
jgi:hypothetical protein